MASSVIIVSGDLMTRYYVRIVVIGGTVYEYEVSSQRKAESDVELIKRKGYKHFEGNAVIEYRQVVNVAWVKHE